MSRHHARRTWGKAQCVGIGVGLAILLAMGSLAAAAPRADTVLVFTTHARPVTDSPSIPSKTYRLDDVQGALSSLGTGLPASLKAAQAALQQRMNAASGKTTLKRLDTAFEGITLAWTLGVERLPAIVFDRQFVVYGVPSVDQAAELFRRANR